MSKALKIAAVVVAVVAITVATAGIGTAPAIAASSTVVAGTTFATAAVAATGASIFGLSVATLTTIATGLSLASSVLAKPPRSTSSANGSQTDWKADPGSGVPYAMGRTFNAGNIVHRASYGGTDNPYESIVTVYSASGPIGSIESVQFDGVVQAIAGGAIGGALAGYAWVSTQLGAKPEAAALAGPFGSFPGWDATSKLSGKMAAITTFKFDKDGKKFPGGEPKQGIVANWVKVYDPRLDSTYPGGSGAHRSNNEATWAWSQNPWLHALTWALGRYENGVRTVGVGIAPAAIDIAAYVEAANVADANSWALGGVIYSTDDKWNAIKQMAAAGGGEPIRRGGQLSAFVNKPRTSLLTIGEDDLTGDVKATAMQSRRSRLNGIVPIYRSEANDWQMVPGTVVRSATYLAEDGALRTREQAYDLVQSGAQVGQLAAYALANGRELSPITVPCKPYMLQVRSGDAVTLNIPSAGLSNQLVVVLRREIDFANATVSLICRTETTAKHSYALGQTSTAPPTPSLTATGNPIVQLPWAAMVGDAKPDDNATRNVDRGAWSGSGVAYVIGDEVQNLGSTWGALTNHTSTSGNGPPALPTTSNTNWRLRAKAGDNGTNGLNGTNGINGTNGSNGQTTYVHFAYADSADGSTNFTAGAPGSRKYVGTLTDFTVADSTNYADYTWSLFVGANGANGTPGAPGADGAATYVHIAYATNSSGTTGFSTTDGSGKTYIGTYTDGTLADSTNPALYTWSLIKGSDGSDGAPGAPGASAKAVQASQSSVSVLCDYSGAVKPGQLPKTVAIKVTSGGVDVTTGSTFSITDNGTGIATSITSSGVLSLDTFSVSGSTDIVASYGGAALPTVRVSWNQEKDAPPPPPTTSNSATYSSTYVGTTFNSSPGANTAIMPPSSSGTMAIDVYNYYSVKTPTNGSRQLNWNFAVGYRIAGSGGGWTVLTGQDGYAAFAQNIAGEGAENSPGGASLTFNASGLTPGQNYEFGLFQKLIVGNSANVAGYPTGSITARQT